MFPIFGHKTGAKEKRNAWNNYLGNCGLRHRGRIQRARLSSIPIGPRGVCFAASHWPLGCFLHRFSLAPASLPRIPRWNSPIHRHSFQDFSGFFWDAGGDPAPEEASGNGHYSQQPTGLVDNLTNQRDVIKSNSVNSAGKSVSCRGFF